jgi:hypothetical protein
MRALVMKEPYWDNGGRRLLRELTFLYLHRQGPGPNALSIAQLGRLLQETSKPLSRSRDSRSQPTEETARARYQRLRHFLFNLTDQPHSDDLLGQLFQLVVPWFDEARRHGELEDCGYIAEVQSRGWFDYFSAGRPPGTNAKESVYEAAAKKAAQVADMLAIGFGITSRDYSDASEHLTGKKRCEGSDPVARDQVGFLTYRYSTLPGNIIRTFTVVTPMSARFPFCWFQSFYRYGKSKLSRDSSGIVVKMGNAIYMFGILPPRDGVELMILPSAAAEAELLSGLVATANNEGTPLMGRVVLVRSGATRLQSLRANEQPGVLEYPIEQRQRLSKEVLWRIRNHVLFEIGQEIVWHGPNGDENITAHRMKGLVARLCKSAFSVTNGAFNPADHIHYPFNQALTTYNPAEQRPQPVDPGRTVLEGDGRRVRKGKKRKTTRR